MYRFNGTPAIGIGVSMAKGGNVLDLGVALEKELTRIESDLPVGIDVHRVANQPEVVEESVGQFTRGLVRSHRHRAHRELREPGRCAPGWWWPSAFRWCSPSPSCSWRSSSISLQRISLGALDHRAGPAGRRRHDRGRDDGEEDGGGLGQVPRRHLRLHLDGLSDAHRHAGVGGGIPAGRIREERRRRILLHAVRGGDHRAAGVVGRGGDLHALHRRRRAQGAARGRTSCACRKAR